MTHRKEDNIFRELFWPLVELLCKISIFIGAAMTGVGAAILLCWIGELLT